MTKQPYATQYIRYPLDSRVLALAGINHNTGEWMARIGVVGLWKHEEEWQGVQALGSKLPEHVAEAIFAGSLATINAERIAVKQKPLKWRA